jgi:hypothetical protein
MPVATGQEQIKAPQTVGYQDECRSTAGHGTMDFGTGRGCTCAGSDQPGAPTSEALSQPLLADPVSLGPQLQE